MATQNPIEQEGTYPLPEAQVDRFMLKVVLPYPKREEEKLIIRNNISPSGMPEPNKIITPTQKAAGNKGVYDVDNGILILTGSVRLDTKTDKITARDSLEYWEKWPQT